LDAEQEYSRMDDSIDASGERDVYFGAADLASWKVIRDDDYAYDWGVEALNEDLGSTDQTGTLTSMVAKDERKHYPFNYQTKLEWADNLNKNVIDRLHDLYPLQYPETKSMKLAKLNDLIRDGLNAPSKPEHWSLTLENKTKEEFAILQAEIMDRARANPENMEWDEKLLRFLGDDEAPKWHQLHNESKVGQEYYDILEGNTNERIVDDLEEVAQGIGQSGYLVEPMFEIIVPVDRGNYTVTGSSGHGYTIKSPDGEMIGAQGEYSDIPDVRNEIESHSMDYGYRDASEGSSSETRWHDYRQGDGGKNYREDLIRLKGDEGVFTKTHHPSYEGIMFHLRSSDRSTPGYKSNTVDFDTNVRYLEELQSDFDQQNRRYGRTEEETADLITLNMDQQKSIKKDHDFIRNLERLESNIETSKRQNLQEFDRQGELDKVNSLLTDGRFKEMDNDQLRHAFLVQTSFWQNLQRGEAGAVQGMTAGGKYTPDQMAMWKEQINNFNNMWPQSAANPQSANFNGWDKDELSDLMNWYEPEKLKLERVGRELKEHKHSERNPIKGKFNVRAGLRYALKEAIKDGKEYLAWTSGEQQLATWDQGWDHNMKKKNKEMFDNLYDQKIPKEAKWLAKKYKGEYGVIDIELDTFEPGQDIDETVKHFSIKITPEMIEAMKKEFPELSTVGRGKVENQGFSDEYIRSKKTGIPQSMYQQFPIPITAGLLATQGEEDNRTGLLQ